MGVRYENLTGARRHLEPLMARLAAECTDAGLLGRLENVLEATSNATTRALYLTTATAFHECVLAMSGNPVLSHLAGALVGIGHRFNERPSPGTRARVRADHLAIGKAILAGDGSAAERLMGDHWGRTLEYGGVPAGALQQRIEWT
jgi:DNA-binding FadR family transcriptional regulator